MGDFTQIFQEYWSNNPVSCDRLESLDPLERHKVYFSWIEADTFAKIWFKIY